MKNDQTILLDYDGVILDTERKIIALKNENDRISWEEFFENLDWYQLLKESEEINDSIKIIKELKKLNKKVMIITKIHTLLEMQAKAYETRKRGVDIPIIFVPPHVKKSQIYRPMNKEILIDDSIKNVYDWNLNGGTGILFDVNTNNSEYQSVKSLEFLLK